MTTTAEIIAKSSRLKVYEKLEVKRKFSTGYDAAWIDLTAYMRFSTISEISKKLDFDSFGYGAFLTDSAKIKLDNKTGYFNNEDDIYSFFYGAISRHYTKVRYSAGYKDSDGTKIDELVFEGLTNLKTMTEDFRDASLEFEILSYDHTLYERTIPEGTLASVIADDLIYEILTSDVIASEYIVINAANINPGVNVTFNSVAAFEKKKIADVINDIAKKTNSCWYIDTTGNFIFRTREENANTPFEMLGGTRKNRNVNILAIKTIDDGYKSLVNQVKYTSGDNIYVTADAELSLQKFGVNEIELEGLDLTNTTTISTLSTAIITDNNKPKIRLVLDTVYMPNVIDLLDVVTVDYRPNVYLPSSKRLLVFNNGTYFNDSYFVGKYANRQLIINKDFKSYGYVHNISDGKTTHFLVEI